MSEDNDLTSNLATDVTSDEEVAAAVEAFVQSVEEDGEILPSRAKAKAKAKPRAGRRTSDETVDSLMNTVNQLANSVTTLAGTVESLGAKVQAPVVVAEPIVQAAPSPVDAEEEAVEASGLLASPLAKLLGGYAASVIGFMSVGAVAWGSMQHAIGAGAVCAVVGGVLAFMLVLGVQDRNHGKDLSQVAVLGVATALIALGIGFILGGILFLGQEPDRAAFLVPIGFVLSSIGSVMRSPHRVSREHVIWLVGALVWICLGLFVGLNVLGPDDAETPPLEVTTVADHGATDVGHGAVAADAHEAPTTDAHAPAVAEEHAPAADDAHAPAVAVTDTSDPAALADPAAHPDPAAGADPAAHPDPAAGATAAHAINPTDVLAPSAEDAAHIASAVEAAAAAAASPAPGADHH